MRKFSPGEWWAVAAAISYLTQGLTLRAAAPTVDPIFGVAVMAVPAWLASLYLVFRSPKRRSQLTPGSAGFVGFSRLGMLALAAAFSYGVGNILWVLALRQGGVTVTVPAIQSTAIWGAVLGCIFLRERITPRMVAGLICFSGGLLLLGWGRSIIDAPGEGWAWALAFGVVAALCWSGLSAVSRFIMLAGADRFTVLVFSISVGLLVVNVALWQRGALSSWWLPPDEMPFLLVAGLCNLAAQVSLTTALSLTEISSVNIITAAGNAMSPVFGFLIFADPLNAAMALAVVLVLTGAAAVQRGRAGRDPLPQEGARRQVGDGR